MGNLLTLHYMLRSIEIFLILRVCLNINLKYFFLAVEIRMFVCYCFLFVIENPEKTIEILELLLKNGADLEAGIGSGETPL